MTSISISQIAAALSAGQSAEAERLSRLYVADHPQDENALLLLAVSLQSQGRMEEALPIYAELPRLFPGSGVHWSNYAAALDATGSRIEAEAAYRTAMRLTPDNPIPRVHLGLILLERKDYVAAREMLLDALELDLNLPMARIHAARACCLCQDFQGAEDLLQPWRQWLPLNDDLLQMELAKLHNLMSDAPAAAWLLEDLLARNPGYVEARLLLAGIYERLNRLGDAEVTVQPLVNAESSNSKAVRNEVDHVLAALALRRKEPGLARRLLEHGGPRQDNDYAHYFDLAEACDKLGDADAAMRALREAHRLQCEDLRIASPEHFSPDALALPAAILRVSADSYARWPVLEAPEAEHSPVFIVGFPRSGTTLLEQMLDAHPGLQSMDENPFFNRLADKLRRHDSRILENMEVLQQRDCDELRKRYLIMVSERINRRWDAQLVDKNPLNMLWVPMIHRLFPKAKYILALRHPCDVILSCHMQNFRSSILGAACANIERLARAYVQAMECWLEDVSIFQPNVLISRYEDLVADPQRHARVIADFLGLENAEPMLGFHSHALNKGYIGTPSYSQVIEPVNRKGLNRWHKYYREFEPVLPILEPMLRHWGYSWDAGAKSDIATAT